MQDVIFKDEMLPLPEVVKKIGAGEFLSIAGDHSLLSELPIGNWIAGTIPYFMTENGGSVDSERLHVTTMIGGSVNIKMYDKESISRIAAEAPKNGFTIVIMPSGSEVHQYYAEKAPGFPDMYFSPIIGWIAGTHLNNVGRVNPGVYFGPANLLSEEHAVVLHVELPGSQVAAVNMVNVFSQDAKMPSIRFKERSFEVGTCIVDGVETDFSQYIRDNNIDTRLPLVADYSGAMVNVSIQEVGEGSVSLYAPVFTDQDYYFAKPIVSYVDDFMSSVPADTGAAVFSCNCILNFLHSELEGRKTGSMTGPVTFGEVAYQLLNQTMVYLTVSRSGI